MKTTTSNPRRRPRAVLPRPALLAAFSLLAMPDLSASAQDMVLLAATPAVMPHADPGAQSAQQTNPASPASPTPQSPQAGSTTPTSPAAQTPPAAPPDGQNPRGAPSPADVGGPRPPSPPDKPWIDVQTRGSNIYEGNAIHVRGGVTVTFEGTTISADSLDGNLSRELVFTGHARIERPGSIAYADAIHFSPNDGRFSLDNPRGVLDPSALNGQILQPLFVSGGELFGNRTGYSFADRIIATTCVEYDHHYELHIANAELIPHKRLILRRVSVIFFGVKVITLPYIIIPLDEQVSARRPRTQYMPEFGYNSIEGYFARFPYTFAEGNDAATFVRLDETTKRGPGYRLEQEYLIGKQQSYFNTSSAGYGGGFGAPASNGAFNTAFGYNTLGSRFANLGTGAAPPSGGLFTMQGYFGDGFARNFSTTFQHQQSIGGSNRFSFSTQLQNNSLSALGGIGASSTSQNTRFDFAHVDPAHGVNDDLNLSLSTSSSSGTSTNQLTGTLNTNYTFDSSTTNQNILTTKINFTHLLDTFTSGSGSTATQSSSRSERLDPQFDLQHVARDWSWDLNANYSIPIGPQTSGSNNGTLEKLPELMASTDTYKYRGGWLRNMQSTFQLGVGEYSEPTYTSGKGNQFMTDRVFMAWNVQPISILRGNTELVTTAGIEQHFYGDGAADYLIHDHAQMRQHLFGRSGIDLTYDYEQPEGGTPFTFDRFQQVHNISAQAGYLEDKHFQFTVRTGYDLLGTSTASPWQSLSTNMMWRPSPSTRFDLTGVYDPNLGKFMQFVNTARFRGKNDLALDIVTNIDPRQPGIKAKFSAINTQFDIPLGRGWRVSGLLNFTGLTGQFPTRNAAIVHDWDCMEATFTYTETVGGYQPNRQFYLSIRIKAFPFFRAFNRGPAGQGLGTGIGNLY